MPVVNSQTESQRLTARFIAFYLPQYHPIPENDLWWGKGFTEWTNVARARPLFRGHYQPHIPADLGFYDLRLQQTRLDQATMAREHGIEGFCYWHYWYAGRKLLEKPLEDMLASGVPDYPFCIAWANHSWTRAWTGSPEDILVEQTYPGVEDHEKHFQYLLPAFTDKRYLTVEGKPILVVMRPEEIPDVSGFTELWRKLAVENGLKGLHLIGFRLSYQKMKKFGFDATSFPNHLAITKAASNNGLHRRLKRLHRRIFKKPNVIAYDDAVSLLLKKGYENPSAYPCVYPNWDSTPRFSQNGLVFHDSTPERFRPLIREAIKLANQKPADRNIVFIKSWNEWAEGNHLEPDLQHGMGYLRVIRDEVRGANMDRFQRQDTSS